ncbi:MAG: ABC transporter ATP-binding protein [Eubacteriales bacterium]
MSQIDEQEYEKPFDPTLYKKTFPFLAPHKKHMICASILILFISSTEALLPLFQKFALDHFITQGTTQGIWIFAGLYLFMLCLHVFMMYHYAIQAMSLDLKLSHDMKRAMFIKLQELSFSFYNRTPVGYTHSRIMSDTLRVGATMSWTIFDCIWQSTYLLSVFVAMLFLNVKLAFIVMIVIPFLAIITKIFQKKMLSHNRDIRKENAKITNGFSEGITGDKASKTLVIEEKNYKNFQKNTENMYHSSVKVASIHAFFLPLVVFFSSFVMALILSDGSAMVAEDIIEIGTLSVFITFALAIFEPVQNIATNISNFVSVQSSVERVFDLLEKEPEIFDTPEVVEKYGTVFAPKVTNYEKIQGDIEFRHVWFRYPDGHQDVLEDFSLTIPAGSTVALVGETGAGKSTLVNIACRFFEPTKGQIFIDGIDYKERSMLWLHSNIGYVLQTPHLFAGTVRENIAYGKLDASLEEIKAACRTVSADKVIEKLKDGYDSNLYESGDSLSTGEKQLLSFARAVLADPSIFILDEATSSIDTQTEQLVQNATDKLLENRTSFVVAHRLSTIKKADIILVIREGKVFEQGTHKELLAKKGYYYHLYKNQFEEDKAKEILDS